MATSTTTTTTTTTLALAEDVLRRFQQKLVSPDQLRREYSQLCTEERKLYALESNFATGNKFDTLNRYCNVIPIDSTIFPPGCTNDASKYFGANLLDATQHGLNVKFVAHQAPVPDAVPAFWDGVYQSRASSIIMLTRLTEGGRHKADQYWPPGEGQSWEMPNGLIVTNAGSPKVKAATSSSCPPSPSKEEGDDVDAVNTSGIRQQQQQLQMELKTPTRAGGISSATTSPPPTPGGSSDSINHTVMVIRPKGTAEDDTSDKTHRATLTRYEGWPDHGVPSTTGSVQRLFEELDAKLLSISAAAAAAQRSTTPYIFVHCSAGIGRTGTFIGGYVCRDLFRRGAFDPERGVYNIVHWMKQRRPGSVQQSEQYVFLHKLLNAEMGAGVAMLRSQAAVATGPH